MQWRFVTIAAACLLAAGLTWVGPAGAAESTPLAELAKPGRVLMMRHATAPGIGDPANFVLEDCSTQRNLDASGRAEASRLGRRLAAAGLDRAQVYSSQWCRCLETARLLALGAVLELPALNSFFGRPDERAARMAALRRFLGSLPRDGPPIVLVTHQVAISDLAGHRPASAGGVILALDGGGTPRVVGTFSAP